MITSFWIQYLRRLKLKNHGRASIINTKTWVILRDRVVPSKVILGKWDQPHVSFPMWSVSGPVMWQRLVTNCHRSMLSLHGTEVLLGSSCLAWHYIWQPLYLPYIWAELCGWLLTNGMWGEMIHITSRTGPRISQRNPALSSPLFQWTVTHIQSDFGNPVWKQQSVISTLTV